MNLLIDLSSGLLLGGVSCVVIGGIGILRLPDCYTRLHAASLTDTLGAGLILLGLMFQTGWNQITLKLLLLLLWLWFTGPIATHALASAARADPANPPPLLHNDLTRKELPPSNS